LVTLEEVRDRLRPVRRWLWWVAALLIAIVLVGGLTRLTGSGLSITEWRPITGVLPPLSENEWLAEFELYRAIPQFLAVNTDMTLAEFKVIYAWEWTHRLLARAVGVLFLLPFLFFLWRGLIDRIGLEARRNFRARRLQNAIAGGWCSPGFRYSPTSASTGSQFTSRLPARFWRRPSRWPKACSRGAKRRPCHASGAWRESCSCSCSCRFCSARWWPRPGRGSRSIPGR
jgi:hypothetical protein